jgi:hypothetical protein
MTLAALDSISCLTFSALWAPTRLSMMTTCPGFSVGVKNLSIHTLRRPSGSRRALHGHRRPHPLNRHARQKGCVLASVARHTAVGSLPFGSPSIAARHGKCGYHIRLQKRAASGRFALPARARWLAPARRALKRRVSFFEWQIESLESSADAGRRHRNAVALFEELLVLFEGEVGVGIKLGR